MAWVTPKTDWKVSTDTDGNYTGDYFNAVDYNRIKNNVPILYSLADGLYEGIPEVSSVESALGSDKTTSDYFYANEIINITFYLRMINLLTINKDYGQVVVFYYANGNTMTYEHLNLIESMTLDLYNSYMNMKSGLRKFTWNFGTKEDF